MRVVVGHAVGIVSTCRGSRARPNADKFFLGTLLEICTSLMPSLIVMRVVIICMALFFGDKCQHATYHAPLTRRKQIDRRAMDWPSYSRDVLISRRGQSDAFNFIATTLLK